MKIISLLLIGLLVSLVVGQKLVNQVRIDGKKSTGGCWLRVINTQQILDFKTDCKLGNMTHLPGYTDMIQFIKPKKAYLMLLRNKQVHGYRYFKDPLNYMFPEYNYSIYHIVLEQQLKKLGLSQFKLPFDERYALDLEYSPSSDSWQLLSLEINYHAPQAFSFESSTYGVRSWLEKPETEKSLATRRLTRNGDNQPVNVTFQLSLADEKTVQQSPAECRVVFEQILPEWFFINYDYLHTVEKYEVFDIELPAHFAKQYYFRYYVPFSKFQKVGPQRYNYAYPMWVRYPQPGESYVVNVGLHPNDRITMECGGAFFLVEEDLLSDRGHIRMYSGKESDTQVVTIATYAITIILCVWMLRKHKKQSAM